MGHPEREMPFCVKRYRILDAAGKTLFEACGANHQTRNTVHFPAPVATAGLSSRFWRPTARRPPSSRSGATPDEPP